MAARRKRSPFLGLLPRPERTAVAQALRTETVRSSPSVSEHTLGADARR